MRYVTMQCVDYLSLGWTLSVGNSEIIVNLLAMDLQRTWEHRNWFTKLKKWEQLLLFKKVVRHFYCALTVSLYLIMDFLQNLQDEKLW